MRTASLILAAAMTVATPAVAQQMQQRQAQPPAQQAPRTPQQIAAQVEQLFQQLGEAPDPNQASRIEQTLVRTLAQSGSPTSDLLLQRATEAMNKGDQDTALNTLNSLVKLAPNFAEAWNRRATLYFLMGNLEASIADCQKVLALEPRHFGALVGLGQIYVIQNKRDDAKRALQRALAAHPHLSGAKTLLEAVDKMDGGRDL
jgi:tetratricopeptide (TPR) repeat protein